MSISIEGRPAIANPVPELAKDSISLLEKLIVTESEVVALEEKPKSKTFQIQFSFFGREITFYLDIQKK